MIQLESQIARSLQILHPDSDQNFKVASIFFNFMNQDEVIKLLIERAELSRASSNR